MEFQIDKFLLEYTNNLSFIHIRQDAKLQLPGYHLPPGGLEAPIITKELAANIKSKDEDSIITVGALLRGMIYLIGIDAAFKYNDEYKKFLYVANPTIEEYIITKGIQALKNKQYILALINFKALVYLNPRNSKALINYVTTLRKYRDLKLLDNPELYNIFTEELISKLKYLISIHKEVALAHYYLGFAYRDKREYKTAKTHWKKALNLGLKQDLRIEVEDILHKLEDIKIYTKGYEEILAGRHQEGLTYLKEIENKYPDWWNLLFFIGLAYRQQGIFHEAVKYFNKVIEIKDGQKDALVELGLSYAGLGEIQKAINIFKGILDTDKNNSEILCNLAMLYLEIGDIKKAKKYITLSLKIAPNDEIALRCRARIGNL